MKIHIIQNDNGDDFAFELDSVYIKKKKVAELLSGIDQVTDVKVRQSFSSPSDVHINFQYQGDEFMVWEPFADSSRYWIGPEGKTCQLDIRALKSVFEDYQPQLIRKICGDLLTLNFAALIGKSK